MPFAVNVYFLKGSFGELLLLPEMDWAETSVDDAVTARSRLANVDNMVSDYNWSMCIYMNAGGRVQQQKNRENMK